MILNYEDTITPLLVIKFIDFKPINPPVQFTLIYISLSNSTLPS